MSWIARLLGKLLDLIPRLYVIAPDEAGVRVVLGTRVEKLGPGWYVFWPMIHVITLATITPQVADLRPQSIAVNSVNYCISGAIQYRIKNIEWAVLRVQDFDIALQNLALGVISEYMANLSQDKFPEISEIKSAVLKGIKENARGWGLEIMKVFITDLGTTKNIRLMGGTTYVGDE